MPPSRPRPLRRSLVLLLLPVLLVAAACGDGGGDDGAAADTSSTTALPTEIPAGTTLRVGDQLDYLKTVLRLGGEDHDLPYALEYSAFVGGPPMLQAFQAGALDAGFVGSTPLIFAQAAGQDLVAIAGWASEGGGYDLVTKPGGTVTGWDDLAGKKVAYQQGTALQAAVLQQLDGTRLGLDDLEPVLLPTIQITSALQSGDADAGILVEPLTSAYLAANPTAKQIGSSGEITDRSSFVITTTKALGDAGKTAALADLVGRLVRSFARISQHPEQLADAVFVGTYGLSPELANAIVEKNGPLTFLDLPDDVVDAQQELADLFVAAGEIPAEVDVRDQFDDRFAGVVEAARAEAGAP